MREQVVIRFSKGIELHIVVGHAITFKHFQHLGSLALIKQFPSKPGIPGIGLHQSNGGIIVRAGFAEEEVLPI